MAWRLLLLFFVCTGALGVQPILPEQLIRRESKILKVPEPVVSLDSRPNQQSKTYPDFYYREYYDPDRSLKVDYDPMETSASEKLVKYSYSADSAVVKPQKGKNPQTVVYGTGKLARPPALKDDLQALPSQRSIDVNRAKKDIPIKEEIVARSLTPTSFDDSPFKPSFYLGNDGEKTAAVAVPSKTSDKFIIPSSKRQKKNIDQNSLNDKQVESIFEKAKSIQKAELQTHNKISHIPTQAPVRGPDYFKFRETNTAAPVQQQQIAYPQDQPLHIQQLIQYHQLLQNQKHKALAQSNANNNFIIKQSTFQSSPGAPTFNVPVPVAAPLVAPNSAYGQFQFQADPVRSGSENVNFVTSPLESSYVRYESQPYEVHGTNTFNSLNANTGFVSFQDSNELSTTAVPLYDRLVQPLRTASARIQKWFEPMLQPWYDMGERIRTRFDLPNDMTDAAEKFSDNVNDYVSRTVAADSAAPLVTIVALLAAGTGAIALASFTTNSTVTLGKRSLDDQDGIMDILDNTWEMTSLEERVEKATSWTDSQCAKWLFCKTMSLVPEDNYSYPYEKKFAEYLDIMMGRSKDLTMKTVAKKVMTSVRNKNCQTFQCLPEEYYGIDLPSLFSSLVSSSNPNSIELTEENS